MNLPRACAYLRVSTEHQTGGSHVSLDVQRQLIERYCEEQGYLLVEVYTDVLSGARADRPAYQQMLQAARRGSYDVVVAYAYDRFGRDDVEVTATLYELRRLKTACEFVTQAVPAGPEGRLIEAMHVFLSTQERRRLAERVADAIAYKVREGRHWGPIPYGWRLNPLTHQLTLDPLEAAAVRRMADLLVDADRSLAATAEQLTNEGHRRRDGKPWTREAVVSIVRRRRNAGSYTWTSKRSGAQPFAVDGVPPLLSAERLAAIDAALRRRQRGTPGPMRRDRYLLSGLARCAHCGETLVGQTRRAKANSRGTRFYLCSGRAKYGPAHCAYRYYNADRLEAAVLGALDAQVSEAQLAEAAAAAPPPAPDFSGELADLGKEQGRLGEELWAAYRELRAAGLPLAQIQGLAARIAAEQQAVEQRITTLRKAEAAWVEQVRRRDAAPERVRRLEALRRAGAPAGAIHAELIQIVDRITVAQGGTIQIVVAV